MHQLCIKSPQNLDDSSCHVTTYSCIIIHVHKLNPSHTSIMHKISLGSRQLIGYVFTRFMPQKVVIPCYQLIYFSWFHNYSLSLVEKFSRFICHLSILSVSLLLLLSPLSLCYTHSPCTTNNYHSDISCWLSGVRYAWQMNSINHLLDIWQVEEEKPPKESTQMIQEKI